MLSSVYLQLFYLSAIIRLKEQFTYVLYIVELVDFYLLTIRKNIMGIIYVLGHPVFFQNY